jgi:hypothetical protein
MQQRIAELGTFYDAPLVSHIHLIQRKLARISPVKVSASGHVAAFCKAHRRYSVRAVR